MTNQTFTLRNPHSFLILMFQKSEKQHVASGISKDLRNILLIVSGMNSVLCFLEMIGSFRATY